MTRGEEEEEEDGEGGGGGGGAGDGSEEEAANRASEQWEVLVRVSPPDAPGARPRAAALRAAKLPSGPFGGSVAGISLSPSAEAFSLVGNVSALFAAAGGAGGGDDDRGGRGIDDTFVYPPMAAA